jgi:hypothetical protein
LTRSPLSFGSGGLCRFRPHFVHARFRNNELLFLVKTTRHIQRFAAAARTAPPEADVGETQRAVESSDAPGLASAESPRPVGGCGPPGATEFVRPPGPCRRLRSPDWRRCAERGSTLERIERIDRRANRRTQWPDVQPVGGPIVTVGATQLRSQRERDRPTKQRRRRARSQHGPTSGPTGESNAIAVGRSRDRPVAPP